MKLGGLYFVEKLDNHLAPTRHLHYNCTSQEKANLTLDYDKWCIGWVLYELTTRGVDNTKNLTKFSFISSNSYLTLDKKFDDCLNPKYPEFNAILKEYAYFCYLNVTLKLENRKCSYFRRLKFQQDLTMLFNFAES